MSKPYLKFTPYVKTAYDIESIVAQQSDDVTTTSLPASATMMWDIRSAGNYSNNSLSGADFHSYGKLENYQLTSIAVSSPIITGYLPYDVAILTELSEYGQPVFNFMSGIIPVISLSGAIAPGVTTLTSTQNASGWADYSTKYYLISTGIDPTGTTLETSYIVDNGTYTPSTYVNSASGNILNIDMQSYDYMYSVSGILSTTDVRNSDLDGLNLSAFEYFPIYPDNVNLELINFDNLPILRTINLEMVNRYGGIKVPLPPNTDTSWYLDLSDGNYDDTPQHGWYNIYSFQTPYFNAQYDTPINKTVSVSAIYFNVNSVSSLNIYSTTVDEFPDEESFSFRPVISNNDPFSVGISLSGGLGNSQKLWRDKTQTTVSATPFFQIYGWDPTQGTIGVDWGDGNQSILPTLNSTVKHTYTVPPLSTYRVITFATAISAQNWLSAHSKYDTNTYMDIEFVDRFLSGNFIEYPQYYFDLNGNYHVLNNTNYTDSMGVCAYGVGSNVIINLSAAEPELGKNTQYQWGINYFEGLSGNSIYTSVLSGTGIGREEVYDFGDTYSYTPGGSAISLTVFNDDFPSGMNPWYYNDDNVMVKYPNFDNYTYAHTTSTDNTNKLFQNVRIVDYENIIHTINPIYNVNTKDGIIVGTNLNIELPSYSPVIIADETYLWMLSAKGWTDYITEESTSRNFEYIMLEGDGTTPGTLAANQTVPITISVSGIVDKHISVRDFDTVNETILNGPISATIIGEFEPNLRIFSNNLHALTGETIYFENITTTTTSATEASVYIWNVGDGSGNITISGTDTDLIPATYNDTGTYSVLLTSITNNGIILSKNFSDIISVDGYYKKFNNDVLRVYGSSGIVYPYQFLDIMVKPNEWVTADNINSAFDKLNDDLEYLKSATKKYLEPPSKYYGWLGQSIYNETDISWHVSIPGINGQYNSTENIIDNTRGLNSIRDVAVYDDILYVMTTTGLHLLSSDWSATEIDSHSFKTIGDAFFDLRSMAINSTGQIYLLDTAVQEVVVFDKYDGNWKFLYNWGKYGGVKTLNGFNTPIDLHIDKGDNVWVTDSGNNVVKKYTKSGSWLMNLTHSEFKNLVSTAIDDDGNIHVLMNDMCMKFDKNGTYINKYNVTPSGQVAKKIINGQDGFMYISYDLSTVKITKNGIYAGNFGDTFSGVSYEKIFHDKNRNLYVANGNSILKYYEKVTIDSITVNTDISPWNMNDIYIDKDEYVQDWVYNRSISRFWDNIEIVKRSITGGIYETTDIQGKIKNIIIGFTTDQYSSLFNLRGKEEIFIGINEIVTADSINRCLGMLFEILDLLIKVINGELKQNTDDLDNTIAELEGIGWRWTDVASWGMNPFTWEQVSTKGFYPTEWRCAITDKVCN